MWLTEEVTTFKLLPVHILQNQKGFSGFNRKAFCLLARYGLPVGINGVCACTIRIIWW
jgi:hypothetical protein